MLKAIFIIAAGGSLGAVARFLTAHWIHQVLGNNFPYGTLIVNTFGSFLAGLSMILITKHLLSNENWWLFIMVGFLGAYTTFSSFSWDTYTLYQSGQISAATFNALSNTAGSLLTLIAGIYCGQLLINS